MVKYQSVAKEEVVDYGDLLARPHFEAVITDMAKFHGITREELREDIKFTLIKSGAIKRSTTELSENELKKVANKLSSIYFNLNES